MNEGSRAPGREEGATSDLYLFASTSDRSLCARFRLRLCSCWQLLLCRGGRTESVLILWEGRDQNCDFVISDNNKRESSWN